MLKRYQLSLTEETVIEFRKLTKDLGFDKNYMSKAVDFYLNGTLPHLKKAVKGKKYSIGDLLTVLGEGLNTYEGAIDYDKEKKKVTKGTETKRVEVR